MQRAVDPVTSRREVWVASAASGTPEGYAGKSESQQEAEEQARHHHPLH